MARVLLVYHRAPGMMWRSTYASHLGSFERFSEHECFYLNTAWPKVPRHLVSLKPDLIIFHYTFLAVRWAREEFESQLRRIAFIREIACPKALIPHDEHVYTDSLCRVVNEFGVTHIFTPASSPQWRQIYEGVDFDNITLHTVLTGYLDDAAVRRSARRSERQGGRRIDVGYRSWAVYPSFGRHGLLKGEIGRCFAERAAEYGLVADISSRAKDAFLGNDWFDFLLDCKYTIGVEGGASVLDRDGGALERVREYVREHEDGSFEEIEAACFPGLDGQFEYRLLGPRHLEAAMTRTCQVLIEGFYGGALEAGKHYIPLREDFSNMDEVMFILKQDELRAEIVERAYEDVIASGRWTYRTLVNAVFTECLGEPEATGLMPGTQRAPEVVGARYPASALGLLNALLRRWFDSIAGSFLLRPRRLQIRHLALTAAVLLLGEERLWRLATGARNVARRALGRSPLDVGEYIPTEAEKERRKHKAEGNR